MAEFLRGERQREGDRYIDGGEMEKGRKGDLWRAPLETLT